MNVITLNREQLDTIRTILKPHGLEDYAEHVEWLMSGKMPPADVLRLISVMCQTCEIRGFARSEQSWNDRLTREH